MGCSQTQCDRLGRKEESLPSMTHLLICANLGLGEHCVDYDVSVFLSVHVCYRGRGGFVFICEEISRGEFQCEYVSVPHILCVLKLWQGILHIFLGGKRLRFCINLSQWKRIREKERWEDKTESCVHRCSSFNFLCSLPQCRSLARLSDVIISFWWHITQTFPANHTIRSPVSTEDREHTLKLSGQNPICASAVCIPSLLVPTLQWSRRSGRTGSSRNHNGHHPDSSHSQAGDEQQGALPTLLYPCH